MPGHFLGVVGADELAEAVVDEGAGEDSEKVSELTQYLRSVIDAGSSPQLIGERVVEAIAAKELYIVTHPNYYPMVGERFSAINDTFKRAQASPMLAETLKQGIPSAG